MAVVVMQMDAKSLAETRAKLRKLGVHIRNKVAKKAAQDGAQVFLDAILPRVPVDKGNLKGAMGIKMAIRRDGQVLARIGADAKKLEKTAGWKQVGKRVGYDYFNEKGTKRQPARPFMTPAFDNEVERVNMDVTKAILKGIDEALR